MSKLSPAIDVYHVPLIHRDPVLNQRYGGLNTLLSAGDVDSLRDKECGVYVETVNGLHTVSR